MAATTQNKWRSRFGRLLPILAVFVCLVSIPVYDIVSRALNVATRPVPGNASAFDPIASYADIAKYVGEVGDNVQLESITVTYVRADGTLDLNANYYPTVIYQFFRVTSTPPSNSRPVGAGGSVDQTWYVPIKVTIRAFGLVNGYARSGGYWSLGMSREIGSPTSSSQTAISPPTCELKRLWSAAMENGAPKDAVARIVYNENAYEFTISDTNIRLKFDNDCRPTK